MKIWRLSKARYGEPVNVVIQVDQAINNGFQKLGLTGPVLANQNSNTVSKYRLGCKIEGNDNLIVSIREIRHKRELLGAVIHDGARMWSEMSRSSPNC